MDKDIVYRVEDGMDREKILCTTYQMRNFYMQFRDGFFTNLDVMNYIQIGEETISSTLPPPTWRRKA